MTIEAALTSALGKAREALARQQAWHESEDKALSKSGRADAEYYWRRDRHAEQLFDIRSSLTSEEYDAAWGRMNALAAINEAVVTK